MQQPKHTGRFYQLDKRIGGLLSVGLTATPSKKTPQPLP